MIVSLTMGPFFEMLSMVSWRWMSTGQVGTYGPSLISAACRHEQENHLWAKSRMQVS